MTITVLVVDNQDMVRAGFAALLDAEPDITVVGQAADGTEAIRRCDHLRADVVLMDIRVPGLDGISALPAVAAGSALLAPSITPG